MRGFNPFMVIYLCQSRKHGGECRESVEMFSICLLLERKRTGNGSVGDRKWKVVREKTGVSYWLKERCTRVKWTSIVFQRNIFPYELLHILVFLNSPLDFFYRKPLPFCHNPHLLLGGASDSDPHKP